jgi:uncharacterized protein YndB with AHSA1/START domain
MKLIRHLLIILGVAAAVFAGGGLLLPGEIRVERSAVIPAPPSAVFPYLNAARKFNEWSPWAALDPQTQYAFTGPAEGVGSRMQWQSAQTGSGSLEIVESVPDQKATYALDFGGMGTAEAVLTLAPEAGGTRVTWGFVSRLPYNPVARWMGNLVGRWMTGSYFEDGLSRLKNKVEKGAP